MHHTISLVSEKYLHEKIEQERLQEHRERNRNAIHQFVLFLVGIATIYVSAYFAYGLPQVYAWYTSF